MPLGLFRNFGVWEILILLFVVLLFFGPKRLPEMGRSLGRGMREFKDSITGNNPNDDEEEDEKQASLTKAEAVAAPAAPAPAAKSEAEQASS